MIKYIKCHQIANGKDNNFTFSLSDEIMITLSERQAFDLSLALRDYNERNDDSPKFRDFV